MANLLEDLKGILSPEDYAKIEGNAALKARASKASELLEWYGGEEPPAVTDPPARVDPPARQTPPPAFDLSSIERMLDAKIGTLNTTIETKIADVVKTRGDELVNNAVKIALQRSDELNRIYMRHQTETGKPFDTTDFNTYLEKPEIKAKGFRTITEAYDAYVAPQSLEREVDKRVTAKLAEKSGQTVPGTTPAPATNSNIRVFMKRGAPGDPATTTGAGRAAAALDKIMARQQEMAS
jgi:hypothetical protein